MRGSFGHAPSESWARGVPTHRYCPVGTSRERGDTMSSEKTFKPLDGEQFDLTTQQALVGRQGLTSTHQRCRQVCSSSELKVSTIAEANYGLSGNTLEAARHGHLLFTTCTDVARADREWPSTLG